MTLDEERQAKEHRWWLSQNAPKTFNWLGGRWTNSDYLKKRFSNFDRSRQPEAFRVATMFADRLRGTLVLYGPFGLGKTHLLTGICNALHEKETASKFCTAPNLFAAIQDCINRHEDYNSIINNAIWTPLLVIDDVDKARYKEFREEVYFDILDGRVQRGLPTAISTNLLSDLGSYVGGACLSRLSIGQLAVEMDGNDYRKEL
ncbi:MAG TPA: DnaA/Hda family protein [Ktedonobacteraceae bacterium]